MEGRELPPEKELLEYIPVEMFDTAQQKLALGEKPRNSRSRYAKGLHRSRATIQVAVEVMDHPIGVGEISHELLRLSHLRVARERPVASILTGSFFGMSASH